MRRKLPTRCCRLRLLTAKSSNRSTRSKWRRYGLKAETRRWRCRWFWTRALPIWDANLLPQGVYVTRTNIYTVNRNQVKVIKIEGDNYIPKGDYTDVFKSWLNWSAVIGGIAGIVILFVMYLILTMFYALCTQVIAKLARRDMAFDSRMRLSAVVLTAAYILFIPLGWLGVSSTLLFLAVMLGALIWFVVKYVPTGKTAAAKSRSSAGRCRARQRLKPHR